MKQFLVTVVDYECLSGSTRIVEGQNIEDVFLDQIQPRIDKSEFAELIEDGEIPGFDTFEKAVKSINWEGFEGPRVGIEENYIDAELGEASSYGGGEGCYYLVVSKI